MTEILGVLAEGVSHEEILRDFPYLEPDDIKAALAYAAQTSRPGGAAAILNFLVDAQLPPALARWIIGQGPQATHVFELGLDRADDPVIWERARSDKAVGLEDELRIRLEQNTGIRVPLLPLPATTHHSCK